MTFREDLQAQLDAQYEAELAAVETQLDAKEEALRELKRKRGKKKQIEQLEMVIESLESQAAVIKDNRLEVKGGDITVRSSDAPWQLVYGNCRVGGIVTFAHTDAVDDPPVSGGAFLHMFITIAGHQIQDVDQFWLDGRKVTFPSGDGAGGWANGEWETLVFASDSNKGDVNQSVQVNLNQQVPSKWTSNHRQRGRAGVYYILKYDDQVFSSGIPEMQFQVRGNNQIYDPRVPSTGYSNNAALCIAEFITNTVYGLGGTVNEANLIEAADICDEQVDKLAGGTENRYEINGVIDTSETPQDILRKMATAIAGRIVFSGGEWYIYPAAWREPVADLTEDDIRGRIIVRTRIPARSNFNSIKGTYLDSTSWEIADFPAIQNEFYITQDSGKQIWQDITLPLTTSKSAAQRIAKIELERQRQQITVECPMSLEAYRAIAGENITLTVERYGWDEKPFEVKSSKLVFETGNNPIVEVSVLLRETAEGVFDWDSGEETTRDLAPDTNLPSPFSTDDITGLVLTSGTDELYLRADGTVFSRIKVSWTPPENPISEQGTVQIQCKKSSAVSWSQAGIVPAGTSFYHILDVQDGINYDVRVRSVNAFGRAGNWVQSLFHLVVGKTQPPSNVSNFTLTVTEFGGKLKWDAVPDLDVKKYKIKVGASWATATFVAESDTNYLDIGTLSTGSYDYLIKAIDTSGNESTTATSLELNVSAPGIPGAFSFIIAGENVVFSWNKSTGGYWNVEEYILSYGAAVGDNAVTTTKSLNYTLKASWLGERKFWIQAKDVAGNVSSTNLVTVNILAHDAVGTLNSNVVDNNVLLKWSEAAGGSLPVAYYNIYKGAIFGSAELIGQKKGTFTIVFEVVSATYTYWVVPVDTAGNEGTERAEVAIVAQPPDFVLRADDILDPEDATTTTNVLIEGNSIIAPVNVTETWSNHFINNGWTNIQDAIDDDYTIFVHPTEDYGLYEHVKDYGAVLPGTMISFSSLEENLAGSLSPHTIMLATSEDGISYTDFEESSQIFASDFQYVKLRIEFGSVPAGVFASASVAAVSTITGEATVTGTSGPAAGEYMLPGTMMQG